ncbi:hypothetical protein I203_102958 [Kwoniella mangroviensis CBS 8507]|uniref:uncharacterized protein n=1 Tax=Kwoniella mangroviensis CBS 8507 TaxID=1296122 RepID=UPI00080D6F3E|nr:uncharacterized protein I203_03936 [Kwoniella mangroviensis CBS 8507]OCF67249.1 hypothetical protein I203_03936 [Kwoniella mangroviensis CBS 8507]
MLPAEQWDSSPSQEKRIYQWRGGVMREEEPLSIRGNARIQAHEEQNIHRGIDTNGKEWGNDETEEIQARIFTINLNGRSNYTQKDVQYPVPSAVHQERSIRHMDENRYTVNIKDTNHRSFVEKEVEDNGERQDVMVVDDFVVHPFFPQDETKAQLIVESEDNVRYFIAASQARSVLPSLPNPIPVARSSTRDLSQYQTRAQVVQWNGGSNSITLILTCLFRPEKFISSSSSSKTDPIYLIKLLPDVLNLADYHQFTSTFFPKFINILNKLNASPLVLYTAYALMDEFNKCDRYAKLTIRSNMLNNIPSTLLTILEQHAPRYFNSLTKLHKEWEEAYSRHYIALVTDLAGVNIQLVGFGAQCKKRFGRGCPGYISSKGNFKELRGRAADAASSCARDNGYKAMNSRIEEAVHTEVGCETCAHRLINAFGAVMSKVFMGVKDGI